MADREYLTSMIQRAVGGTSRYWAGLIADYLIAHGVEAVVRCKDCAYWNKTFVNGKGFRICPASGMDITEDDFCSYGERRDSDG